MYNYQFTVIVHKLSETEKMLNFGHIHQLLVKAANYEEARLKVKLSTNFTFKHGKNSTIYYHILKQTS